MRRQQTNSTRQSRNWALDSVWSRPCRGPYKPAQGTALGNKGATMSKALKGRDKSSVPHVTFVLFKPVPSQGSLLIAPFQGCGDLCRFYVPRAVPWADLLPPLRGIDLHIQPHANYVCPGLICYRPFGAKVNKRSLKTHRRECFISDTFILTVRSNATAARGARVNQRPIFPCFPERK